MKYYGRRRQYETYYKNTLIYGDNQIILQEHTSNTNINLVHLDLFQFKQSDGKERLVALSSRVL